MYTVTYSVLNNYWSKNKRLLLKDLSVHTHARARTHIHTYTSDDWNRTPPPPPHAHIVSTSLFLLPTNARVCGKFRSPDAVISLLLTSMHYGTSHKMHYDTSHEVQLDTSHEMHYTSYKMHYCFTTGRTRCITARHKVIHRKSAIWFSSTWTTWLCLVTRSHV